MKLSKIKINPNNPRFIRDEKFEKLKKSIKDFPQMLAYRPIVVNDNFMALGGNMRLKALQELGFEEIPEKWIKKASDLTKDQQREFIIKDNVSFGQHDWDVLANEWEGSQLEEWGVDIPITYDEDDIEPSSQENEVFKLEVVFETEAERLKAVEVLESKNYKVNLK